MTDDVSIYDAAWRALTGRDDQWGGCAQAAEVERIVQFALDTAAAAEETIQAAYNALFLETRQSAIEILHDHLNARPVRTARADVAELIAEARTWPRDGVNEGALINALADALEATTGRSAT